MAKKPIRGWEGIVVMRVDPALPRAEKCTLVLEAIGDDKVRVNHQSLDSPLDRC